MRLGLCASVLVSHSLPFLYLSLNVSLFFPGNNILTLLMIGLMALLGKWA